MKAAANSLLELGRDPKWLGAPGSFTPNARTDVKRVFADGDFRLEQGKIVEHWDVRQLLSVGYPLAWVDERSTTFLGAR